jgi:hypothetical protein
VHDPLLTPHGLERSVRDFAEQIEDVLSAERLNVHASYGPHATVFAFRKGLEGTATTGDLVTDWTQLGSRKRRLPALPA